MTQYIYDIAQFLIQSGLSTFLVSLLLLCLLFDWKRTKNNYEQCQKELQTKTWHLNNIYQARKDDEKTFDYLRSNTQRDLDPELNEFVLHILHDGSREACADFQENLQWRTQQARIHSDELGKLIEKRIQEKIAGSLI